MKSSSRLRIPPIPLLLVSATSIQGGAALAKQLFPALGATGTSGLRLAFAALLLVAIFRPRLRGLGRAQWKAILPYGIALGTMNLTFYEALARIPLGLAVSLEFVGPLGVAIAGSRRPLDLLWALLAGAGILLISPWTGVGADVDPLGVALALTAGACWAAYIVFGKRLSGILSAGQSVSVGMLVAAAVVLPFSLADGVIAKVTPELFGLGLGVAVLSSALPYTAEMVALKALPERAFSVLMSIEPIVATLVGLAFLGEMLAPAHWLAVALVTVASAGTGLSRAPEERKPGADLDAGAP